MRQYASDIAFTPAVKGIQEIKGSRRGYSRMEQDGGWRTTVTPDLAQFLAGLDMFYLGTASAAGQPYIQYRGRPPRFLKVLDETTLAFADFGGNRQYITLGNLTENPRAFLFLMDYANRQRIKLWGTTRVVEDDGELLERLSDPEYPGRAERPIVFTVEAWDINRLRYFHSRYAEREVRPALETLQARIGELEEELARLKAERAHDL